MKNLAAIILAAGKGTRMKSRLPKVIHPVAGRPMLHYPVSLLKGMNAGKIIIVIGHGADDVRAAIGEGVTYVIQEEQLGTGHAVMCAAKELTDFKGDVLILSGDVPLITKDTLSALFKIHAGKGKEKPVLSLITAIVDKPSGYGRIVRDENRAVERIVEEKDSTPAQKEINEINAGLYLVDSDFLFKNLKKLRTNNAQGEYYLPDLVWLAASTGQKVSALTHLSPVEVMGINNRVELARANAHMRKRINERLMLDGVTMLDPETTYIESDVIVGPDTTIYPGVHLLGSTVIGGNCTIEEGCRIKDTVIGDFASIKSYTIIEEAKIGNDVAIGPFARLRPGNVINDKVRIGNFVEVKKSTIGRGSKANHLTYLGDSVIGEEVNIGAGTITCNYDGVRKHQTTIEDGAFIGSDSQLVAPVTVGKGAYVGSGTTVTKDVPPGSLMITRAPERIIEGWVEKKMKEKKEGH